MMLGMRLSSSWFTLDSVLQATAIDVSNMLRANMERCQRCHENEPHCFIASYQHGPSLTVSFDVSVRHAQERRAYALRTCRRLQLSCSTRVACTVQSLLFSLVQLLFATLISAMPSAQPDLVFSFVQLLFAALISATLSFAICPSSTPAPGH